MHTAAVEAGRGELYNTNYLNTPSSVTLALASTHEQPHTLSPSSFLCITKRIIMLAKLARCSSELVQFCIHARVCLPAR